MWFRGKNLKVYVYRESTDMRCSFSGLALLVESELREDSLSGDLFVFVNRRRDYVKVLYWERGGYCLWSKRLEAGTFSLPKEGLEKIEISVTELGMLLDGFELKHYRRRKRYEMEKDILLKK